MEKVTGITFSLAGALSSLILVTVFPMLPPAQPAAATTLNVTPAEEALPPVRGVTVIPEGTDDESTVKGVPPTAADVTDTIWARPGV
jgi:hypothetical protein